MRNGIVTDKDVRDMANRIGINTLMFVSSTMVVSIRIPCGQNEYADFQFVTYDDIDGIIEALEGAFLIGEPH